MQHSSHFERVKEIGFHSLLYLLGGVTSIIASIALMPVYTRFLSNTDYGIIEVIDSARNIAMIVLLQALVPAIAKFYHEASFESDRRAVIGSAFWGVAFITLLCTSILLFYRRSLAIHLLGLDSYIRFVDLAIALLAFQAILSVADNYLYVCKLSGMYLTIGLVRLIINISINLYCIICLHLGALGMLYGELISCGIILIVYIIFMAYRKVLTLNIHFVLPMFRFGLPFVPNMLCATLIHRADRLFLPLADAGIYGVGYRFPFLLNSLLLGAFSRVWNASSMYEIDKMDNPKETFARISTYVITIYVIAQYSLIVCASTLVKILTTSSYFGAWRVIPIVGLGMCFYMLHNFFIIGAFLRNKTWHLLNAHLSCALLNLFLNYLFLPKYGYIAAAWISLLTYALFSLINYLVFRRIYPIDFDFKRLRILFASVLSLIFLNLMLRFDNPIYEGAKQILFAFLLPFMLIRSNFFDNAERQALFDILTTIDPRIAWLIKAPRVS